MTFFTRATDTARCAAQLGFSNALIGGGSCVVGAAMVSAIKNTPINLLLAFEMGIIGNAIMFSIAGAVIGGLFGSVSPRSFIEYLNSSDKFSWENRHKFEYYLNLFGLFAQGQLIGDLMGDGIVVNYANDKSITENGMVTACSGAGVTFVSLALAVITLACIAPRINNQTQANNVVIPSV